MKKVLLIEDNADVRETTAEILELAGYEVVVSEDGKAGVNSAKQILPDIIICDIMMPELDGYGVLNILSRFPETAGIPFIFLTAKTDKSDVRKGMNLGADDYITKPFEESELLDAIEIRLKRSEIIKKVFKPDAEGFNEFMDEACCLEELKDLSRDRKIKTYRKKEVLFREDDYANFLYFIVKGKIKCVKTDAYGKELVNDLYGPGQFIGYMTLLDGNEYSETAIAMVDSEVTTIPREDFLALIQRNRDVAIRFIKMLSGEIREREKRLLQLAYTPVRERVADALLKLMAKESPHSDGYVLLRISREDLASIVGTAKESLIRMLSELKRDKYIETEGQSIRILDKAGLEKTVSGYRLD